MFKNLFKASAMIMFMAIATLGGVLTSCGSDEATPGGDNNSNGYLVVSVTPGNISTRAAATATSNATENNIVRLAVAVVGTDGSTLETLSDGNHVYTTTGSSVHIPITGGTVDGKTVLVAVNFPESRFSGVTTKDEFKAKVLTAEEALYGADSHSIPDQADNDFIPMYGEATVSPVSGQTGLFRADVNVYHLIAKVTLKRLTIQYNSNDAVVKNATFQPTEIFMVNVPNQVNILDASKVIDDPTDPSSTPLPTPAATPNYLSGEQTGTATNNPKYLSTGALSTTTFGANVSGLSKTWKSDLPVFYTTPNTNTASGDNNATFLVIKGKYSSDGTSTAVDKYYPVYINLNTDGGTTAPDGGTPKVVSPNINYNIGVTITGEPSDSPTELANLAQAQVHVMAADFSETTVDDYIIGQGQGFVKVGDYYFSDGTWGSIVSSEVNSSHYPIAVVFSDSPSAKDIAKGYTHGYAVALTSYGSQLAWAVSGAIGHSTQVQDNLITTLDAAISDLDGYSETQKIAALSDFSESNYPAAYNALNFSDKVTQTASSTNGNITNPYKAPAGSSGWYLGSIGQYYLLGLNLGGDLSPATSDWKTGIYSDYWYYPDGGFATAYAIDTYLSAGQSDYIPTITTIDLGNTWYWTSSEYSATIGFNVSWSNDFYVNVNLEKSFVDKQNRGIRPVIAF